MTSSDTYWMQSGVTAMSSQISSTANTQSEVEPNYDISDMALADQLNGTIWLAAEYRTHVEAHPVNVRNIR